MEKLMAMWVAATLTNAVMTNLEDNLKVSPDISDPNLRAENLMCWELFRIFYHATRGALEDETSWKAPKVNMAGTLAGILQGAIPLVTGAGPLAPLAGGLVQILEQLIRALPAPVTPPTTPTVPIPDPGAVTTGS